MSARYWLILADWDGKEEEEEQQRFTVALSAMIGVADDYFETRSPWTVSGFDTVQYCIAAVVMHSSGVRNWHH